MKEKITRPLLEKFRREGTPRERLFDSEDPGFFVRKNADGTLSFGLMYGPARARRVYTLGRYGSDFKELGEARAAARAARSRVREGGDPTAEKRDADAVPLFKEWAEAYIVYVRDERHKKTWKRDRQYLALAMGLFGSKRLTDVTERDCEAFYSKTRAQRGDVSANRALASLRACLNRARRKKWIKESPANDIDRQKEPNPRTRVFTEAETARLLEAVAGLESPYARAGLLLMFSTGCRLGEALNLRWEDVDLERGRVDLPNPKAGKPQALPLMPAALNFLKTLPRASAFVVAGRSPDKPRMDLKRAWNRVVREAKEAESEAWIKAHPDGPEPPPSFLDDAHLHDIRRTVLTRLAERYGVGMAQLVGRHSSSAVTWRHYVHAEAEAMRAPLEGVTEEGLAKVLAFPEKGGATGQG